MVRVVEWVRESHTRVRSADAGTRVDGGSCGPTLSHEPIKPYRRSPVRRARTHRQTRIINRDTHTTEEMFYVLFGEIFRG